MAQYEDRLSAILDSAQDTYEAGAEVQAIDEIPSDIQAIPLDSNKWLKLPDVTCVFIDMKNSTQLSANKHDKTTAAIYQYFTGTAVRILDFFEASYIDVRGDGAFGLFENKRFYHGLAAGITFKTFATTQLPKVVNNEHLNISAHIGIDKKTVLVKRIGLRNVPGNTTKQNEVWAGKPVNMAAKLASIGEANELSISDRVYDRIVADQSETILLTCGCPNNKKVPLWEAHSAREDINFDFEKMYKLISTGWCKTHGQSYCETVLQLDQ